MSIEVSTDGKHWSASIIGLDKAAIDQQFKRLKAAGASIARAAARVGQKEK
jgi:methionine synthase I (cobalamin-dependent)